MAVQGVTVRRPWLPVVASFVLFFGGLWLLKSCVFDVLAAASRHEGSIEVSTKAVVLAPGLVILGAVAVITSITRRGAALSGPQPRKLTPLGMAMAVLILALGGALHLWMNAKLETYGYGG